MLEAISDSQGDLLRLDVMTTYIAMLSMKPVVSLKTHAYARDPDHDRSKSTLTNRCPCSTI
jgi:hypothetical protein